MSFNIFFSWLKEIQRFFYILFQFQLSNFFIRTEIIESEQIEMAKAMFTVVKFKMLDLNKEIIYICYIIFFITAQNRGLFRW